MAELRDKDATAADGPPTTRRFMSLLQNIDDKSDAEAQWRQLEQEWLTAVLQQPVIGFEDVQIAAELMARHLWEDAGSNTPRGRAAFQRLYELRHRRGVGAEVDSAIPDR